MGSCVRAVLLDVVGTVLDPEPSVADAYARAGHQFGSRLQPDQIEPRFHGAFKRQEHVDRDRHDGRTDDRRERDRWRAIVHDVFDDVDDREGLFETLWDHFAQSNHWRVFDDVPEAIESLVSRGLIVGLASNFDARLHQILRDHKARVPLDHVFVSSELGHRKPSPGFFVKIQEAMSLEAHELMLVGDSLQNDLQAASSAGWRASLLNRRADSNGPNQITSLSEVASALESA